MRKLFAVLLVASVLFCSIMAQAAIAGIHGGGGSSHSRTSATVPNSSNKYDTNSLSNPYGAGSPYKANGYMNSYSRYGSRYSNYSHRNPYATQAPRLYDSRGRSRGRWSANRYGSDSTSNPYGRYGSRYSPNSINNPYGAGNHYSTRRTYVQPGK